MVDFQGSVENKSAGVRGPRWAVWGGACPDAQGDAPRGRRLHDDAGVGCLAVVQNRVNFEGGDRHVTADQLHAEAAAAGVRVSLATIYNTLNQFTSAGVLREVVVEIGRAHV